MCDWKMILKKKTFMHICFDFPLFLSLIILSIDICRTLCIKEIIGNYGTYLIQSLDMKSYTVCPVMYSL